MNFLYKAYCRAFQFAFKAAMPVLPYRAPEVSDSVERIALVLREREYENVLIVTDKIIREVPVFKRMEEALSKNKIKYEIKYHFTIKSLRPINIRLVHLPKIRHK